MLFRHLTNSRCILLINQINALQRSYKFTFYSPYKPNKCSSGMSQIHFYSHSHSLRHKNGHQQLKILLIKTFDGNS